MTPAAVARARERGLLASELADAWPVLSAEERLEGLRLLPHAEAEDLLLSLPARDQAELILETSPGERRSWMRLLPDRKSTRLNSSHTVISYAVFCLKKKKKNIKKQYIRRNIK